MKKLLLAFCILILSVASARALTTNTIDGIDILIFGDADTANLLVVNTNFIAMGNGISKSCDDITDLATTQSLHTASIANLISTQSVATTDISSLISTQSVLSASYASSSNDLVVLSGNYDSSSNTLTLLNSNVVLKTGGTFSDSVLTERDFDTTGPTSDELISAGWARKLLSSGEEWFFTADANTNTYFKTNIVNLSETAVSLFTNSITTIPDTSYIAGGVATNYVSELRSPLSYEIYMDLTGGNTSTLVPVGPEVYYIYENTTNHLGDWEAGKQNITTSTDPDVATRFTILFTEPVLTGSVEVVSYLKSGVLSGTTPTSLNIYGGGTRPSHMSLKVTADGQSFADALHINGDNAMTAPINAGGQDITNGANVDITGTYKTNGVALDLGGSPPAMNTTTVEFTQEIFIQNDLESGSFYTAGNVEVGAGDIYADAGDIYATLGDISATNGSMIAKTGTLDVVEYTGSVDTNMLISHLRVGDTNYMSITMFGSTFTNLYPLK